MNEKTLNAIRKHAADEYPRECCGLILVAKGRERYVRCQNLAQGTEHFVMAPADYAAAEEAGDLVAVVHSHPDAPAAPSEADLVSCEATGLPWHILSWPDDDVRSIEPSGYVAPLVGRTFAHGVLDCWSLVRDFYARELHIELPDFERRDDWWAHGENLYMDGYPKAGFVPVSQDMPEKVGDVILMQRRSDVPNHAGVYLGDGLMLHHMHGRLSTREVYGGYWREITRCVLRHRNLLG
ncbi:peptidase P60 [Pandoraea pnomenusa]|uniref:C40 family peptidase n=1 Tax=Pandoraea pnomenusa TaxID=93220 RepID=UPI00043754CD|nr:C40 family peptidase [Pandoraea pnomenusa]AHN74684.1 peptidase P60 [Pandoraea pnomenusa]